MRSPFVTHLPLYRSRGFSIIEMLVGVLIISFGLLGLITLQSRSLQMATTTEDAQRAALLANEMAAVIINANNVTVPARTVQDWAARAADPASGGMRGGNATVNVDAANNTALITVTWTSTASTGTANDNYRYVTTVIIPQ